MSNENSSEIVVFEFRTSKIRTVLIDDEPHFVAKDVAEALEYSWKGIATISHIPDQWRGVYSVQTPPANVSQEMLCLTEQGVNFFVFRSDKPKALPFQMWLAGEVLPSIRKHGMYATPNTIEKILTDPDFIIKLAQELKDEKTKRIEAEKKIEADAPKVLFSESVSASSTDILIGNMAKILKQNGINIGQNRFYKWLRQHGYLMKDGIDKNKPTQKGMNLGVFRIQERVIQIPDKDPKTVSTTMITGKGQNYFVTKFLQRDNRAAS